MGGDLLLTLRGEGDGRAGGVRGGPAFDGDVRSIH